MNAILIIVFGTSVNYVPLLNAATCEATRHAMVEAPRDAYLDARKLMPVGDGEAMRQWLIQTDELFNRWKLSTQREVYCAAGNGVANAER